MADVFFSRPDPKRTTRRRRVVENDQDMQLSQALKEESATGPNNFTKLLRDTAKAVINKARVVQSVASSLSVTSIPVYPDAWAVRQAMDIFWPGSDKSVLTFEQYKEAVNRLYLDRPGITGIINRGRPFGLGPAGVTTTRTSSGSSVVSDYTEHLALLLGAYQMIRAVSFPEDVLADQAKDPPGSTFSRIAATAGRGLLLLNYLNRQTPGNDFLRSLRHVVQGDATPEETAAFTGVFGNDLAAVLNAMDTPDVPPDPSLLISEQLKRRNVLADTEATYKQLGVVVRYAQEVATEQTEQGHLAWIAWYRAREAEGRLDPLVTYNVTDDDVLGDSLRKEDQDCVHTSNVEATNKLVDDLAAILNSNYTKAGVCCLVAVLAHTAPSTRGDLSEGSARIIDLLTNMRAGVRGALALTKIGALASLIQFQLFDTTDFENYSRNVAVRHLAHIIDSVVRGLATELRNLLTGQSEAVRSIIRTCTALDALITGLTSFLKKAADTYLEKLEEEMDRIYNRAETDDKLNALMADLWQFGYWDKTLKNLIDILKAAHDCVPEDRPTSEDLFNRILDHTPSSVAESDVPGFEEVGDRFSAFLSTSGVTTASGVHLPSVLHAREQARLENETQIVGRCLTEHGALGAGLVQATQSTIERVRDERVRERLREQQQLRRKPPR